MKDDNNTQDVDNRPNRQQPRSNLSRNLESVSRVQSREPQQQRAASKLPAAPVRKPTLLFVTGRGLNNISGILGPYY